MSFLRKFFNVPTRGEGQYDRDRVILDPNGICPSSPHKPKTRHEFGESMPARDFETQNVLKRVRVCNDCLGIDEQIDVDAVG